MVAFMNCSSFAPTRPQGIKVPKIFLPADHPENGGISATVRREMGADISAACGQLRANRNAQ